MVRGRNVIRIGTKILYDGEAHTVVGLEGPTVRLRTISGRLLLLGTRELFGARDFGVLDDEVLAEDGTSSVLDAAMLDSIPKAELRRIRKLRAHLLEAVTGYPSGDPEASDQPVPRPEYDPEVTNLGQRIATKAREISVSESKLRKLKRRFEESDLLGLVDGRVCSRRHTTADRLDPRVREAILLVLDELVPQSNVSRQQVIRRVQSMVEKAHGEGTVEMPSRATFYRALAQLAHGRGTFGAARARRNAASRPPTTYRRFRATRPGEIVLIDTTSLDVFAADPLTLKWVPVDLTLAIDLYTRSILAWRFTPRGTKGVDAALILRDIITPLAMRPGWPDSVRWPYHGVPEQILFGSFGEEEPAARPLVYPETVVVDHGLVYESEVFRAACRLLGVNIQSARPYAPTDKAQIERTFRTIRQSLLENLPGYKGPDVWSRGERVEEAAYYFIEEIEEIFARWVVCYWQERPHGGLHLPGEPRAKMSPNDAYELGLATAGFVAVPPTPDLYYELLSIAWRKIGHDGVSVAGLRYDGDAVNACRNRDSDYVGVHRGKWPLRYDPRDHSRIFFRDPDSKEWHGLRWVDEPLNARPFGDTLLAHAKGLLRARGDHPRSSRMIASVLEEIFERVDGDQAIDPKERRALADAFVRGPQAARDRGYPEKEDLVPEVEIEEDSVWDRNPSDISGFAIHGEVEFVDDPEEDPEEGWEA